MGYALLMRKNLLSVSSGIIFVLVLAVWLHADELQVRNGDRLSGKVLSLSGDSVILESATLGKIAVPRKSVASLAFGTNTIPQPLANKSVHVAGSKNLPLAAASPALGNTNADLSATFPSLGEGANMSRQIRDQMLAGSPEAARKYDEMLSGLLSGKLNLNDLRREARSAADQLRELKRELGSDADDALDGYLAVLDNFLKDSPGAPSTNASPALPSKAAVP